MEIGSNSANSAKKIRCSAATPPKTDRRLSIKFM